MPYKWKVSKYLQLGSDQIQTNLNEGLGKAFSLLYSARKLFDLS